MDLTKIEDILKLMQSYGLQEFEIEENDTKLRLVQGGALNYPQNQIPGGAGGYPHGGMAPPISPAVPAKQSPVDEQADKKSPSPSPKGREIRSPFVGTFYAASSPEAENFVEVGQKVKKGDTLCIVEAMKLMNEIEAEFSGVISKIMVENEEPIEYDQVLFLIE